MLYRQIYSARHMLYWGQTANCPTVQPDSKHTTNFHSKKFYKLNIKI